MTVTRKKNEDINMVVKTVVEAQDIFDKAWEGFKGVDWKEKASVSRFVQANYTPYDGDESFLAGPTERSLHIKKIVEEMKIIISWYNTEKEMIEDSWYQMIQVYKPMYLGIFNAVYDVRHTQYRADKLGIPQHKLFCHPKVGNRFDFNYRNEDPKAAKRRHNYNSESYTKIVDVQQSYFGLRPQDQLERESLDAVSKHELGFGKLSYAHITDFIGKLPYEDYWVYVMYNMIDVIVMAFNDIKTDDISSLLTRRFIVRTEFDRVYSPMTSVTNTFFHLCKRMGYIMSNDVNKLIMTKNESAERIIERLREVDDAIESTYDVLTNRIQIAGGLCSDPNKFKKEMTPFLDDLPNNKFLNKVMDADALSMYPMIVEHTNVSKDSLDGRIEKIEISEEKEIPVEKGIQALIDKDVDIIGTAFFNLPTAKDIASFAYNIKTNKPYVREETPAYTLFLGKDDFKYAEAVRKVLGRLDNTKVDASDIKAGIDDKGMFLSPKAEFGGIKVSFVSITSVKFGFFKKTYTYEDEAILVEKGEVKFEKKYIDEKRFYPIITDFRRTSQPFVNYYLNDILVEATEPCECGSVLQRIEKIEGRSDDIFKFINKFGKEVVVFPDFIRRTILFVENIREYQVFQINSSLLEIAILNINEEQKELIRKEFNKLFSSLEIENIEIKFIDYNIDRTKKLKRVVRKVIE